MGHCIVLPFSFQNLSSFIYTNKYFHLYKWSFFICTDKHFCLCNFVQRSTQDLEPMYLCKQALLNLLLPIKIHNWCHSIIYVYSWRTQFGTTSIYVYIYLQLMRKSMTFNYRCILIHYHLCDQSESATRSEVGVRQLDNFTNSSSLVPFAGSSLDSFCNEQLHIDYMLFTISTFIR